MPTNSESMMMRLIVERESAETDGPHSRVDFLTSPGVYALSLPWFCRDSSGLLAGVFLEQLAC